MYNNKTEIWYTQFTNRTAKTPTLTILPHTQSSYIHRGTYLCDESVDEDRFGLPITIDPEQCLKVMWWIPASIKDDHTVGWHQVNTKASGSSGDQEETDSEQAARTWGELHACGNDPETPNSTLHALCVPNGDRYVHMKCRLAKWMYLALKLLM